MQPRLASDSQPSSCLSLLISHPTLGWVLVSAWRHRRTERPHPDSHGLEWAPDSGLGTPAGTEEPWCPVSPVWRAGAAQCSGDGGFIHKSRAAGTAAASRLWVASVPASRSPSPPLVPAPSFPDSLGSPGAQHRHLGDLGTSPPSMEVPGPPVSGKPGETSVKWQLCYDMTAKMWWMVSAPAQRPSGVPRRLWGSLSRVGRPGGSRATGDFPVFLPGKEAEAARPRPGTGRAPSPTWARVGAPGVPRALAEGPTVCPA